jgi:hypothetical protein
METAATARPLWPRNNSNHNVINTKHSNNKKTATTRKDDCIYGPQQRESVVRVYVDERCAAVCR